MPSEQRFKSLPKAHTTYTNIIKSFLPIGDGVEVNKDELPEATYIVDQLAIDKENLTDYCQICGFAENGQVPVTYFAVLSQTLQMNMMVKEPFPFTMLGLVHVENTVIQYRTIVDTETAVMSVTFANLRDHDKGQQFDFLTTVKVDDELVWEGTSTYLSRIRSKSRNKKKVTVKPTTVKPEVVEGMTNVIFEAPEDIGRRYAFISGDFNLIHLHPLSARAFGFPKAIAHGMWSKAKVLSQLDLPEAFRVDVSFQLPIFLPSEVELIAEDMRNLSKDNTIKFDLYNAKNAKPHLSGKITLIENSTSNRILPQESE